ncbi:MAG: hypothetical protein NZ807_12590 [Dehalococcoidia bacterium]|nr:hypothetical protein [Dehalococcoidia bacterium]
MTLGVRVPLGMFPPLGHTLGVAICMVLLVVVISPAASVVCPAAPLVFAPVLVFFSVTALLLASVLVPLGWEVASQTIALPLVLEGIVVRPLVDVALPCELPLSVSTEVASQM